MRHFARAALAASMLALAGVAGAQDRTEGFSVHAFTVKEVRPLKTDAGPAAAALLAVTATFAGERREQIVLTLPEEALKRLKPGQGGYARLHKAELTRDGALRAAVDWTQLIAVDPPETNPPPSSESMIPPLWLLLVPPAEAPGLPGGDLEPIVPEPPKEEPPDMGGGDDDLVPDDPGTGDDVGGPRPPTGSRPGDDGDGIDNGVDFAEMLCEGAGDGSVEDVEGCIADMLDPETTLQTGGTEDPEDGGYTGGNRDEEPGDTGDTGLN